MMAGVHHTALLSQRSLSILFYTMSFMNPVTECEVLLPRRIIVCLRSSIVFGMDLRRRRMLRIDLGCDAESLIIISTVQYAKRINVLNKQDGTHKN